MDSGKIIHRRNPVFPGNTLKTSQKNQNQQGGTKSLELSKVIRLLEDPLTASLKERHLFVLRKLLKRSHVGFMLKELSSIARILNVCAEKAAEHPEYSAFLCEAVKLCRLPFLKEKTSDELLHAQDLVDFLCQLGYLMRVSDADVRRHIVETVKSFYSRAAPKPPLDGLQPTSPGLRLQLLEHSDLAQTLLLALAATENQSAASLLLLQTLQLLSSSSDLNCAAMLRSRGAETICLHMNQPDPSGQILFRSAEILWNLLERGDREQATGQLSSLECVVSLKEAFLNQLLKGSENLDLTLRNDLLVITTLIAENPDAPLIESLFAKQIVTFATFPEMKSGDAVVLDLKLTFGAEDLRMKKLLLNLLVLMSRDSAALELYKEEQLVLALLALVKPPAASWGRRPGVGQWSWVQWEELQLQALATLTAIAPLLLEDFMSSQGSTYLLLLLDWCVGPDPRPGRGQALLGAGGSRRAPMRHCVRLLRAVTSLGEDRLNQDLCDQGLISQLLGILTQMEADPDEDDEISLEMKADLQLILSTLCDPDMHRKELFGSEGVELTLHFLKKGCEKFYSGLGHNKLVLSTVDCVWSCIVGCYTTEDYFLAKEGAFLLLDLLSASPRCVHGAVVATLLELCDNPNTLAHILAWRGGGGRTAPGLLLQLWRGEEEEEEGLGGGSPEDPQSGFQPPPPPPPPGPPSAAVLELSENLRAKIYFILCKLGFQEIPGLSAEDLVTLSRVRRYLDLKVGQVWAEIRAELSVEGVRPTSPDRDALASISRVTEDWAGWMSREQDHILQQQQWQDAGQEEELYSQIKSQWKQRELKAESWDRYVSRTSNYQILKEIKAEREKNSESSRAEAPPQDAAARPPELFIGHLVALRSTGEDRGPAGVKVTLARAPVRSAGPDEGDPAAPDPEYFSTVSVRH